ncbi:MAG: hypothetical protein KA113_00540 [Syntrophaceae bacterium]|nr:hypothetical protein [Syntrophaceae bacterium]
MKRCGLILLVPALGLLFCLPAWAVDLKLGGTYYAGGLYLDRTTVKKGTSSDGPSTAFYFQRLRAHAELIVAPGLSLITRFDVMERSWGAPRATPGTALDTLSAGTRAENENIAFDWAYLHYKSPVGQWRVGYLNDGAWGTVFMDTSMPRGKMAWSWNAPNWMYTIQIVKMAENSRTALNPSTAADLDGDKYCTAFRYSWKNAEAGILIGLGRDAARKPAPDSYKGLYNNFMPFARLSLGPVKLQTEVIYFIGKLRDYEDDAARTDVQLSAWSGWLDATADFGRFYAGGTVAYVAGDDPGTADKAEGDALRNNGGRDWNPCLIMWNDDFTYWVGNVNGYADGATTARQSGPMYNAWFFQLRGGVRPCKELDIAAFVSYANADKKPTAAWLYNDYGYEVDLTATWKITRNLSYMLGAGYLFTGKYYKGASDLNAVRDNYLLLNKLTLTF